MRRRLFPTRMVRSSPDCTLQVCSSSVFTPDFAPTTDGGGSAAIQRRRFQARMVRSNSNRTLQVCKLCSRRWRFHAKMVRSKSDRTLQVCRLCSRRRLNDDVCCASATAFANKRPSREWDGLWQREGWFSRPKKEREIIDIFRRDVGHIDRHRGRGAVGITIIHHKLKTVLAIIIVVWRINHIGRCP